MLAPALTNPDARQWAILVRECRRNLGLKQLAFADLLGTSQSAVSRWEAGAQVPGYAMQNRVKDLLYKPLYNDRADKVVVAQVRHGLGHVSLFDRDMAKVVISPGLERDHGGPGRLQVLVAQASFQESYRAQLERCSWRAPLFTPQVVMVTWISERLVLGPGGEIRRLSYARTQWSPVALSCGQVVMRGQSWNIGEEEGQKLFGALPEVLTLDDLG